MSEFQTQTVYISVDTVRLEGTLALRQSERPFKSYSINGDINCLCLKFAHETTPRIRYAAFNAILHSLFRHSASVPYPRSAADCCSSFTTSPSVTWTKFR